MLWDQVQTNYQLASKIEKISISQTILPVFREVSGAGILAFLVSAIRCEANWSKRETHSGSRAIKMLGYLLLRSRGLAQHVAAANARAKVRARIIVCTTGR